MDANKNIEASIKYMSQNLQRFGGDKQLSAIAYNAGPGTASSYKKDPGKILPAETQNYVAKTEQYYYVFNSDTKPEPEPVPDVLEEMKNILWNPDISKAYGERTPYPYH
jgi:hypothetical protein